MAEVLELSYIDVPSLEHANEWLATATDCTVVCVETQPIPYRANLRVWFTRPRAAELARGPAEYPRSLPAAAVAEPERAVSGSHSSSCAALNP